jgi:hypothetical protein
MSKKRFSNIMHGYKLDFICSEAYTSDPCAEYGCIESSETYYEGYDGVGANVVTPFKLPDGGFNL